MSRPVKRRQEVDLSIENVAFGGKGIAHIDAYVVFVENTLPGDRVRARVRKARKNYAEAYPVELLDPSPLRQDAPCAHFGWCGGCKWQHVDYAKQLEFKRNHVAESLTHIGGIAAPTVHAVLPAPDIFRYRNKMEFSFSENRWLTPEELKDPEEKKGFALGMHVPRHFDRIIDIRHCWLMSEKFNQVLAFSREYFKAADISVYDLRAQQGELRFLVLRESAAHGTVMVNVVTLSDQSRPLADYAARLAGQFPFVASVINTVNPRAAQIATGDAHHLLYGDPVIHEQLGGHDFEISPNSFFQTNTRQAENLYGVVRDYADLQGGERLWDLYCGAGSIALFMADAVGEVIGFEIVENAVADAERNAARNGIGNCTFVAGDLRFNLERFADRPPDVLVVDPPRSGMHPDVVTALAELAPPKLVYVSCNPATMARDLAGLVDTYAVAEVQPVDMFPHTYHIESVARLVRREKTDA